MNRDEFDTMFDELFEQAVRQDYKVEIPDPEASWQRLAPRLAKARRRGRIRQRLKTISAMVACMLLGALLFGQPLEGIAHLTLGEFIANVRDGVVSFVSGPVSDKWSITSPPPDGIKEETSGGAPIAVTVYSLEEARTLVSSGMKEPGYIPEGYRLDWINLEITKQNHLHRITYMYKSDGKSGPLSLQIRVRQIGVHQSLSLKSDSGTNTKVVYVNGNKGMYASVDDKNKTLHFQDRTHYYTITSDGELSEQEIMKIAEQIR